MSLHSYPSLISDATSSSATPSESDPSSIHPADPSQTPQSSLSITTPEPHPKKSGGLPIAHQDLHIRKDKSLLEDYATELQFRIRQLEQERMKYKEMTNQQAETKPSERSSSRLPKLAVSSPSSPTLLSNPLLPKHPPSQGLSNSLPASSSIASAKCTIVRRESPGSSQIPTPKGKLVPKRGMHVETTEEVPSVQEVPAMIGLFSSETVPRSGNDSTHNNIQGTKQDGKFRSQSLRVTKPQTPDDHLTKRTGFTSKLDSIVLTSKLFPFSSSRLKASRATTVPGTHSTDTPIPSAPSSISSTPQAHTICLDSPPSKSIKSAIPRQNLGSLPEVRDVNTGDEINGNLERKSSQKFRGRVSFSDRLFTSSSTRIEEEADDDADDVEKIWGSWSKKKFPRPLLLSKERRPGSPSQTATPVNSVPFNKSESVPEVDDARKAKRRSLQAPQCLRNLVQTSSSQAAVETREQGAPLSKKTSTSRSRDAAPLLQNRATSKDSKKQIRPSRVGSPIIPKGRLSEPQAAGTATLERTNSMRSAGKWGQRGSGGGFSSSEFTRGRTAHPMFSFERPCGSEATSTTSSRETLEARQADSGPNKSSKKTVRVAPARNHSTDTSIPSNSRASHGPAHSSSQDNSTCGRTTITGVARSDPGGMTARAPLMRTRMGAQAHGTFAFEPAAAVVILPRSTTALPRVKDHVSVTIDHGSSSADWLRTAKMTNNGNVQGVVESPLKGHMKSKSESRVRIVESHAERKVREYAEFCEDLKVVLGDGADWAAFMNYVRRFDLHILSADLLLQRVKKLIDCHRSVDGATRTKLYERFVKIVHDADDLYG